MKMGMGRKCEGCRMGLRGKVLCMLGLLLIRALGAELSFISHLSVRLFLSQSFVI